MNIAYDPMIWLQTDIEKIFNVEDEDDVSGGLTTKDISANYSCHSAALPCNKLSMKYNLQVFWSPVNSCQMAFKILGLFWKLFSQLITVVWIVGCMH